jgi:hypothetical protein
MNTWEPFAFRWTVAPGNSQLVVPFDSTYGSAAMSQVALAAGSPFLAPGQWRGRYRGMLIRYSIRASTTAVTVDEQDLTGAAGTSADWETQGTIGTFTATAGTTFPREFKPLTPDARILVTAGGTGPTALVIQGAAMYTSDYGN